MNRSIRVACGFLVVSLLTACDGKRNDAPAPADGKDPAEAKAPTKSATRAELGRELGTLMESFGTTVQSVADQATWSSAKEELARIEARIEAITTELKILPPPSPAETQVSLQAMKQNEDNLSKALGDKNAFMKRLPPEVSSELGQAAGAFSRKMGTAQQALYGRLAP